MSAERKPGHDRWNFIVGTPEGLRTRSADLLRDAVTVVIEQGILWTRHARADVWATETRTTQVKKFPPGLVVWGPPADAPVWLAAGIQFHPLPDGSVMGPGNVPRPADAFFRALELACGLCEAKTVRIFGCEGWQGEERWKRFALGLLWRDASSQGVEIQRPYLLAKHLR